MCLNEQNHTHYCLTSSEWLCTGTSPLFTQLRGHNLEVTTDLPVPLLTPDLTRDAHGPISLPGSLCPAIDETTVGLARGSSWADEMDSTLA